MRCHCYCTVPLEKPAAWCTESWKDLAKPLNSTSVCTTIARIAKRILMALVLILISAPCYAMGLVGYLLNKCKHNPPPPPPPPPSGGAAGVLVPVPVYVRRPTIEQKLIELLRHQTIGSALVSLIQTPSPEDADPALIARSRLTYPEQRTGMAADPWLHTLRYLDNQDLARFSRTGKIYSVLSARAFIRTPRVTEKRILQVFIRYLQNFNGIINVGRCSESVPCQHNVSIRYRIQGLETIDLGRFDGDFIYNFFFHLPVNLMEGHTEDLQYYSAPRWAKPLKVNLINIDLNALTP